MILIDAACEYKLVLHILLHRLNSSDKYPYVVDMLLTLVRLFPSYRLYFNVHKTPLARTYPVSGKFTSAQAELYGAVLAAQKHLVTLCSESSYISLAELHRESCNLIRKELNRIGFNLHGHTGTSDVEAVLYPHYVGHPIGIGMSNLCSNKFRVLISIQIYMNRANTIEAESWLH